MGDEDKSVQLSWRNHMHPFVPSLHRKLELSNSRYYQRFINGDSIYTCFDLGSEREFRPSNGRSIVQPHRKSRRCMLVEHGPWFLGLEAVLKHRDQGRSTLWERRQRRKLMRASKRAKLDTIPSLTELTDQHSPEGDEVDGSIPVETRTDAALETTGNFDLSSVETPESPSRAKTPDLPSSDLLRTIHYKAMMHYDSHNVLTLPPIRVGRKPFKWEEPIAMARAFDGSALLAIGQLFMMIEYLPSHLATKIPV